MVFKYFSESVYDNYLSTSEDIDGVGVLSFCYFC